MPHVASQRITLQHLGKAARRSPSPSAVPFRRPCTVSAHRRRTCCADRQGANFALEELAKTKYDVISLDWGVSPEDARRRVGRHKTLQVGLSVGREPSAGADADSAGTVANPMPAGWRLLAAARPPV